VDSVREQEKLEARKILENAAESHTSGARCVRRGCRTFLDAHIDDYTLLASKLVNKHCK
jgi:hypothetical protein